MKFGSLVEEWGAERQPETRLLPYLEPPCCCCWPWLTCKANELATRGQPVFSPLCSAGFRICICTGTLARLAHSNQAQGLVALVSTPTSAASRALAAEMAPPSLCLLRSDAVQWRRASKFCCCCCATIWPQQKWRPKTFAAAGQFDSEKRTGGGRGYTIVLTMKPPIEAGSGEF